MKFIQKIILCIDGVHSAVCTTKQKSCQHSSYFMPVLCIISFDIAVQYLLLFCTAVQCLLLFGYSAVSSFIVLLCSVLFSSVWFHIALHCNDSLYSMDLMLLVCSLYALWHTVLPCMTCTACFLIKKNRLPSLTLRLCILVSLYIYIYIY